jgi:hypothetical protein
VDPVPDPLIFFSGSAGNRTRASGSVAKNSDHQTIEAVNVLLQLANKNGIQNNIEFIVSSDMITTHPDNIRKTEENKHQIASNLVDNRTDNFSNSALSLHKTLSV